MRIGFVTDEISANAEEAITLGLSWGIHDYELRMIGDRRVPNVDPAAIRIILELQRRHHFRITALSPGIFKSNLQNDTAHEFELQEILPETFRLARLFDAKKVIVFGFQRSVHDQPGGEAKVLELFGRATTLAQQAGFELAVENEPGFWCDTGVNTARILATINSPHLLANWDPGNAVGTDEPPYPDGYLALKKWIGNVHVKDTIRGSLVACVPVGEGKVDWKGQLHALAHDKIVEHITIETHCPPLIENSKKNLEIVRQILSEA